MQREILSSASSRRCFGFHFESCAQRPTPLDRIDRGSFLRLA